MTAASSSSPASVAGGLRARPGLEEIPAIVEHIDDEAALEIAIIENLQREDLSPLDEAVMFERMTTDHGYSVRKLASKLGQGQGLRREPAAAERSARRRPRPGRRTERHALPRVRADEGRRRAQASTPGEAGRDRRAQPGQAASAHRGQAQAGRAGACGRSRGRAGAGARRHPHRARSDRRRGTGHRPRHRAPRCRCRGAVRRARPRCIVERGLVDGAAGVRQVPDDRQDQARQPPSPSSAPTSRAGWHA